MKTFNNNTQSKTTKQGASTKRIGQYLRRWLRWSLVGLFLMSPAHALPDGTPDQCFVEQGAVNKVTVRLPGGDYTSFSTSLVGESRTNGETSSICYVLHGPDAYGPACEGPLPNFTIPDGVPFFANFTTSDLLYSCVYKITLDSTAGTAEAVQYIQIPENTPPVANDDAYTTACKAPITFNVIAGSDTDADAGDTLSIESFTTPTSGSLNQISDTEFEYTPDACGTDVTFDYTLTDQTDTDDATVTITVEAAPVITDCTANDIGCISEVINFNKTPFCDSITENEYGNLIIPTPFGPIEDTVINGQSNDLDGFIREICFPE